MSIYMKRLNIKYILNIYIYIYLVVLGFPGVSVVKNPPASVGDARDVGSVLCWEDVLEEDMATGSSILAWRAPWAEEPGGLQSMGSQRVRHG